MYHQDAYLVLPIFAQAVEDPQLEVETTELDENFYPSPDNEEQTIVQPPQLKYINMSNYARRIASLSRCFTLLIMDICREESSQAFDIEDSEEPLHDLPSNSNLGAAVMLFSCELGESATEWAPNPVN